MITPKNGSQIEHRVTAVEVGIENLTKDVSSLAITLREYANRTSDAIDRISERIGENQKTSWSTLASWAAVIISIVALGISGFVRDLGRLEDASLLQRNRYVEHIKDGHPLRTDQKIDSLTARLIEMDTKHHMKLDAVQENLRREIWLRDKKNKERFDHFIIENGKNNDF